LFEVVSSHQGWAILAKKSKMEKKMGRISKLNIRSYNEKVN